MSDGLNINPPAQCRKCDQDLPCEYMSNLLEGGDCPGPIIEEKSCFFKEDVCSTKSCRSCDEVEFTCLECEWWNCEYAFDPYSTNGDCLCK